ncbi:MAG: hypothetical protein Q7T89_00650 [Anaerolineales bacterium]|nr:hypothetical protein [Anaerolineales bacterium]
MNTEMVVLPKGTHNILRRLTGQSRPDVALSLAIKQLVRLRTKEAQEQIKSFENKYNMTFVEFEKACDDGRIEDPFSYEVEKDDFEWEAAITDLAALEEISQWIV